MGWLAVKWTLSRTLDGWTPVEFKKTHAWNKWLALCIIGAQFLSIGLLGEMIAAFWTRDTDTYSIAEHTVPRAEGREQGAASPDSLAARRTHTT
jgi:hypothetical protein